jgi:two-component system, chemotaxis family, response regulator WspF
VQKCAESPPDLILMDLIMPEMNGVEATRRIMQSHPCAILLVTSSTARNLSLVYEAMGHGALDAVNTPTIGLGDELEGSRPLLKKIDTIARLLGPSRPQPEPAPQPAEPTSADPQSELPPLIAIGASTGGPQALAKLLAVAPANLGAAVVIAQHIDLEFAPGLVQWLSMQTPLPVELAREGQAPQAGRILVAGTNDHLVLAPDRTWRYTPHPTDYSYRPSVDALFESLAQHWPDKGSAVVLTGMGRDGSHGLLRLRSAGWRTIAQDEKSCVVYGMPKAAAQLDAAAKILPIEDIGPMLFARE